MDGYKATYTGVEIFEVSTFKELVSIGRTLPKEGCMVFVGESGSNTLKHLKKVNEQKEEVK